MTFYQRHLFFCTNHRDGENACDNHGATTLCSYAKQRFSQISFSSEKTVRFNRAGCLGQCDDGPVVVVYPEAVWYTFTDASDIDEIIDEHLVNGRIVERLRIDGQ